MLRACARRSTNWSLDRRQPVLGICVGMQMLRGLQRRRQQRGPRLDPRDGAKIDFDAAQRRAAACRTWAGTPADPPRAAGMFRDARCATRASTSCIRYYFDCAATATRRWPKPTTAASFACAVQSGNVFGVQFHPEKSHQLRHPALQELRGAVADAASTNHSLPAGRQRRARQDAAVRRRRNTSAIRSTPCASSMRRKSTS